MGCITAAAPSWGSRGRQQERRGEARVHLFGARVLCPPTRAGGGGGGGSVLPTSPSLQDTRSLRTWCEEEGREDLLEKWRAAATNSLSVLRQESGRNGRMQLLEAGPLLIHFHLNLKCQSRFVRFCPRILSLKPRNWPHKRC